MAAVDSWSASPQKIVEEGGLAQGEEGGAAMSLGRRSTQTFIYVTFLFNLRSFLSISGYFDEALIKLEAAT